MARPSHLFYIAVLFVILTAPALAEAGGSGSFVAVYNSGRAQVRETRVATLPEGPAAVVFSDVPETLDPVSVRATAPGMTIRDIEYRFKAITPESLLDEYVGKELNVILPDPADANGRILRKARLLSNQGGRPVFAMGKEIYVGNYEAVLLPDMPKGFDQKPTLTLTTDNSTAGKKNVGLHYLMGGLNWRADYTMTVNADGSALDLEAWATVSNSSNYPFRKADLRLVAGDVQRDPIVYKAAPRAQAMLAMDAGMPESGGAVEESFSEYHVYTLGRAVTLPAQGSKQVGLFSAAGVPIEQELVSRFHAGSGQRNGKIAQSVESAVKFKNVAAAKLGRPMPAGMVRVFMPTSDGSHLVAGETRLGHVAEGGEVRLVLGRSFDVTVERTQTSFEKVGKNAYEIGWAITVKNGKKMPQDLKLKDTIPGQWKMLSTDTKYAKVDSGTIEFDLKAIPPTSGTDGKTIKYSVRIQY